MNPTILACIQTEPGLHQALPWVGSTSVGYSARRYGLRVVHSVLMPPLEYLNLFDGIRMLRVHLDGIRTRDVH